MIRRNLFMLVLTLMLMFSITAFAQLPEFPLQMQVNWGYFCEADDWVNINGSFGLTMGTAMPMPYFSSLGMQYPQWQAGDWVILGATDINLSNIVNLAYNLPSKKGPTIISTWFWLRYVDALGNPSEPAKSTYPTGDDLVIISCRLE